MILSRAKGALMFRAYLSKAGIGSRRAEWTGASASSDEQQSKNGGPRC